MDKLKIILDFGNYTMTSFAENWTLPLTKKYGHAYIEWANEILYTEKELRKKHRHFFHPTTDKMYAVLKRADPTTTNYIIYDVLDEVRKTCDVCQMNAAEPYRLRVSMPAEECVLS